MGERKKIFVGMSGGVDSSVSAALLKEEGHDVVGVFIKVWQADFLPCTWREERREAMRAAAHLGIPFLTLDLEKEYKEEVVDYMIREYGAGRVPNPDVMCNKHVKFGAFLDFALAQGADAVATGHYARVQLPVASCQLPENSNTGSNRTGSSWKLETGNWKLLSGVDKEKDQSYFLWTLGQKELAHTLFPVGHLEKREVRVLAKKFGLSNAEKKDSQGLCFMGKVDMAEFLRHYLKTEKGNVLASTGEVIGEHDGALLYTIGQRHGLRYHHKKASDTPLFVVSKDLEKNTVTVSHQSSVISHQGIQEIQIETLHAISGGGIKDVGDLTARYRYRGELEQVSLEIKGGQTIVIFKEKKERHIAPGQSLVLYRGEECLGGGVITSVLPH